MSEVGDDHLALSDSVVMGDINIGTGSIAECPMCGIQGVPVLKCNHEDCKRRFCSNCEKGWKSFREPKLKPLCAVHNSQAEEKHHAENLQKHGVTRLTGSRKVRTFRPSISDTNTDFSTSGYSIDHPDIITYVEPSGIWRWVGTISIAGLCIAVLATVWSWFGRGNI